MTKKEVFDLCTISITHNNITYSFLKPKDFQCKLLDVRIERYHNIIAHIIDKNSSSIAICYNTSGFVHDGRKNFDNFALTPTSLETFFDKMLNI